MRLAGAAAAEEEEWPLAGMLAGRTMPVSYAEWLRIETAEADLTKALDRGAGPGRARQAAQRRGDLVRMPSPRTR